MRPVTMGDVVRTLSAITPHPIPNAALDQPLCIVGTVGSGKTYAAKSAVERLLDEGRRVIIVDPTGVWHGLRTMADGTPGFPVVIFGGEQADVPVSPDAGAVLGELLAGDQVTQAIVDVSDMTGGERTRFLTAMLERLYVGARVPRHLVLDEADEMASQTPLPEQLRLLGIVDKIVRRGRVRGFRPMMITQRPAVLHKNVLSQIATLVAMRLTSPQDRKAVEGWVRGSADLEEAKAVLASLPKLAVGEGWVWAPREGVLERTRFPAIATLDTSATPDNDAGPSRPRAMAPVDVAALREALAVVSPETPDQLTQGSSRIIGKAQAGATTPDVLSRRDRQQTTAEAATKREELEAAERRGYERGVREAAERINGFELLFEPPSRTAATIEQMDRQPIGNLFTGRILALLDEAEVERRPDRRTAAGGMSTPYGPAPTKQPQRTRHGPAQREHRAADEDFGTARADLTPALQRVLDALGWWRAAGHHEVPRARACVVAGYSPNASTFGVYIGELAKRDLVATGAGVVQLTEAGLQVASVPEIAGVEDLRLAARMLLKPQEARVFDVIYDARGAIRRDQVAKAVGLSPTASTAGVYIGSVSAFGLIEPAGRGAVRAAPWLYLAS